jgi:hypothetical protein
MGPAPQKHSCLWVDSESSGLADLARIHVLFTLFQGDPELWLAEIDAAGPGPPEFVEDIAFLRKVQAVLASDAGLRHTLETIVSGIQEVLELLRSPTN